MVITFDSSNIAVTAYEILKNRLFDEKKLLGRIKYLHNFIKDQQKYFQ